MFFEMTDGNFRRMIDESRQAFDLDERFEKALRNTAMTWRQAVDRRLRRRGMSRVDWMTIAAAMQARTPLSQSMLADGLAVSRRITVPQRPAEFPAAAPKWLPCAKPQLHDGGPPVLG